MSKEMLPEKKNSEHDLGPASTAIIKEEISKSKREGIIVIVLMAVGIAALVLASAFLMPYVTSLRASVPLASSSIIGSNGASVAAITPLPSTFKAGDITGGEIDLGNAIARSDRISISGYSDNVYSTDLQCLVDTLPVYCDGSPIIISGLPDGDHELRIVKPSYGEPLIHVFNWKTIT
ncbi:MAG: hypothetical protein ACJ70X_09195 [Nitrososphaera sp.]